MFETMIFLVPASIIPDALIATRQQNGNSANPQKEILSCKNTQDRTHLLKIIGPTLSQRWLHILDIQSRFPSKKTLLGTRVMIFALLTIVPIVNLESMLLLNTVSDIHKKLIIQQLYHLPTHIVSIEIKVRKNISISKLSNYFRTQSFFTRAERPAPFDYTEEGTNPGVA